MEKQIQCSAQHRGVSRMHLRNIVGRHMGSTPYFPRWRESRVGYASSVLFVGLGFVLSFLGDGSTFWFTLPLAGQDAPAPLPREHERGE